MWTLVDFSNVEYFFVKVFYVRKNLESRKRRCNEHEPSRYSFST